MDLINVGTKQEVTKKQDEIEVSISGSVESEGTVAAPRKKRKTVSKVFMCWRQSWKSLFTVVIHCCLCRIKEARKGQ